MTTNKNLDYYLSLPYTIELTPDVNGTWFVEIPLLKGCMTQGDSREEAKTLWLETALEEGIAIPERACFAPLAFELTLL